MGRDVDSAADTELNACVSLGALTGTDPKVLSPQVDEAMYQGLNASPCKILLSSQHGEHQELLLPDGNPGLGLTGTRCYMNLESVVPALANLLKPAGLPAFTVDRVNAYVSQPGTGSPTHFDTRTVVIVQLVGRKLWMVSKSPAISNPHRNCVADPARNWVDYDGTRLTVPDDFIFVLLKPGDWLLIRKAAWHATYSSAGSISATLAAPAEVD